MIDSENRAVGSRIVLREKPKDDPDSPDRKPKSLAFFEALNGKEKPAFVPCCFLIVAVWVGDHDELLAIKPRLRMNDSMGVRFNTRSSF